MSVVFQKASENFFCFELNELSCSLCSFIYSFFLLIKLYFCVNNLLLLEKIKINSLIIYLILTVENCWTFSGSDPPFRDGLPLESIGLIIIINITYIRLLPWSCTLCHASSQTHSIRHPWIGGIHSSSAATLRGTKPRIS